MVADLQEDMETGIKAAMALTGQTMTGDVPCQLFCLSLLTAQAPCLLLVILMLY